MHAFTRREAKKPIDEREVIFEVRRAQVERINAFNDFLIDSVNLRMVCTWIG